MIQEKDKYIAVRPYEGVLSTARESWESVSYIYWVRERNMDENKIIDKKYSSRITNEKKEEKMRAKQWSHILSLFML